MNRRTFAARTALGVLVAAGWLLAPAAHAQRVTVRISVDTSAASTRLVLTHSEPLAYEIFTADGQVQILYAEPVRVEPSQRTLGDPILGRFELRDSRLVLETGPGFRSYETFELRNPFRLVVDLLGSRVDAAAPLGAVEPTAPMHDPVKTVIVIDPGHGGVETGAIGPSGLQEKEVTLDLARRLRQTLARDQRLAVVLTRDEDRLVGLDERTAIANHNRADLFLSIHINSSTRNRATGAETYFLSAHATDDEARTLAALENREGGGSTVTTPDGERRDLQLVLWDLAQNQHLAVSSVLAENMQRHLNELTGTRDRGVRQAPFRVLMGATMPAILVEVGFISNPAEEERLRQSNYRDQVVQAMTRAVFDFLGDMDRISGSAPAVGLSGGAAQP